MTAETTPVSCAHEAYQGQCAHCGVPIVNGFPKYPAVQPAAGREEIARIVSQHLPTSDCPDSVCLPITMTAGDLRAILAALAHPPAQGSESGGKRVVSAS